MPARPFYFHRLTEAITVFRQLPSDWIDRHTLEQTLGVSKTVAWRVLRQCGATEGLGNSLVCRRLDLIEQLEQLQQTGAYRREIHRRQRLENQLAELLVAARSRHIPITSANSGAALLSTRLGELPPGINLAPRRLTIDFDGFEDFLHKTGALVFALHNDYERIRAFLGSPEP